MSKEQQVKELAKEGARADKDRYGVPFQLHSNQASCMSAAGCAG